MFYLSGTTNALLLRIARPKLLLLTRPNLDDQPGTELAPQSPVGVPVPDAEHSLKQTGLKATATVTADGGSSSNSTALSRFDSKVSV